jgi:tetratricopeptide (TPR) repeat protein
MHCSICTLSRQQQGKLDQRLSPRVVDFVKDRFRMNWLGTILAIVLGAAAAVSNAQQEPAPASTPASSPSPVDQGLAALKAHQPQQALAAFQQALQTNPDDVAVNLYAAGAALELYQGDLAVKYAEKARQLDPDNWKVHTTLVVAYAVADRTQDRNTEREVLRKLHADPKAPDAMQTSGFVVDMFPVKQYHVDAVEYFSPLGKFHIYYRFLVHNAQGKRVWIITVESNDFDEKSWEQAHAAQAAAGERQFQISGEGGDARTDYQMFSGKPVYDPVKAQVVRIISGQTAPFPGETP